MSDETLISYAQNGEDVVLLRALGHVQDGRYVDVGACDPVELSVTKALYDRGWRGLDIDAVPEYAAKLRETRPGNEVVQAAISDRPVESIVFHQLVDTGLSTLLDATAELHESAGFERRDITVPVQTLDAVCERSTLLGEDLHILKVDVEGAEAEVLRSFDLRRWRPWVVVVEATEPLSTEPSHATWDPLLVAAGYTFTLFDGLSRFYVSPDHPELLPAMSYPACVLDDYVPVRQHRQDLRVVELVADVEGARREVVRWRRETVTYWANAVAKVQHGEADVRRAQADGDRLRAQARRLRQNLKAARGDRKRLRGRLGRLEARIRELEQAPVTSAVRARRRVGAAVAKVRGS